MPAAAHNLESSLLPGREKLLDGFGILRTSDTIAEQYHAGFDISCLPGVKKAVGNPQREYISGIGDRRRFW